MGIIITRFVLDYKIKKCNHNLNYILFELRQVVEYAEDRVRRNRFKWSDNVFADIGKKVVFKNFLKEISYLEDKILATFNNFNLNLNTLEEDLQSKLTFSETEEQESEEEEEEQEEQQKQSGWSVQSASK